jgi:hypothetical protein
MQPTPPQQVQHQPVDHMAKCSICNAPDAKSCSSCHSAADCDNICQKPTGNRINISTNFIEPQTRRDLLLLTSASYSTLLSIADSLTQIGQSRRPRGSTQATDVGKLSQRYLRRRASPSYLRYKSPWPRTS